uniref:Uncharacterized protein n=1 Tax=Romanomermis culicivorax TaxID=13658 RepID=A0A915KD37_ROMCU
MQRSYGIKLNTKELAQILRENWMALVTSRRRRRRNLMGIQDDDDEWSSDPEIDALLNEVLKLQVDCSAPPVPERWRTPEQPDEYTPQLIKLILNVRDRIKQVISSFVTLCSKRDKTSSLTMFIRKATNNLLRGVDPGAKKYKNRQEDRRNSTTAGSYTNSSKRSSYDSDSGADTKDSTRNHCLHRLTSALAEVLEKKIGMRNSRIQKSRSMTNLNGQKIYDLLKDWDT